MELESVTFNGETIDYVLNNSSYSFEVELLTENTLIIVTKDKPLITYVDIEIDTIEFTYNKTNQYSDLKPYYMFNEDKVFVEFDLYLSGVITNDFTLAGSYELRCKNVLENFVFTNASQTVTI